LELATSHTSVQKVSRCNYGIHEGIWKGLLPCASGKMNDQSNIFTCCLTVLTRKEIPFDQSDLSARGTMADDVLNLCEFARRASKAYQIAKTTIEQLLHYTRTDEACCSGH
jgi:hypothetical protein